MTWLRGLVGKPRVQRADHAINVTSEFANTARSLREQLEPFSKETDPFTAIFAKKGMAEDYEDDMEFNKTPRAKP